MLGSKIHSQTIAITIMGVIKGRKYAVLKNSLPLILLFKTAASTSGSIIEMTAVEIAKTNVFFKTSRKDGLVKISLYLLNPANFTGDSKSQSQKLRQNENITGIIIKTKVPKTAGNSRAFHANSSLISFSAILFT